MALVPQGRHLPLHLVDVWSQGVILGMVVEGKLAEAQNNTFINNSCRLTNVLDPVKVLASRKTVESSNW